MREMTRTRRIRNALQRLVGKLRVIAGRLSGRRRTTMRGLADQRKADLKDDVESVKDVGRKTRRRLSRK